MRIDGEKFALGLLGLLVLIVAFGGWFFDWLTY